MKKLGRVIGVTAAHETLERAASFFGAGLRVADGAMPESIAAGSACRAKLIGNGLRELDRFLSVLIDEIMIAMGSKGCELPHFLRQRNTANKLRILQRMSGLSSPDDARLRALGRSRDCLYHCSGIVRRSDVRHGAMMTVGWPAGDGLEGSPGQQVALGDRLSISMIDLHRIGVFYRRVASELVAALQVQRLDH